MRVAMLMDSSFAARERAMLSRLEIGLADEGVRLAHAVPQSALARESVGLYSVAVGFPERGLPFTLRQRADDLCGQLLGALDLESPTDLDLIHVWSDLGGASAPVSTALGKFAQGSYHPIDLGFELARRTGAGLVIEVWTSRLLNRLPALFARAAAMRIDLLASFPDATMAKASGLDQRIARSGLTSVCPWGVRPSDEPHQRWSADTTPALGLITDGSPLPRLTAVLTGLAALTSAPGAGFEPPMIFVGAEDRSADLLWRAARKLRLLNRLTLVPQVEAFREPALDMDALLFPGACGTHRTLPLDALASGLQVISGGDTIASYLQDPAIVELVTEPLRPQAWEAGIRRALSMDAASQAARVAGARAWVRAERTCSAQVACVLRAYEALDQRVRTRRESRSPLPVAV